MRPVARVDSLVYSASLRRVVLGATFTRPPVVEPKTVNPKTIAVAAFLAVLAYLVTHAILANVVQPQAPGSPDSEATAKNRDAVSRMLGPSKVRAHERAAQRLMAEYVNIPDREQPSANIEDAEDPEWSTLPRNAFDFPRRLAIAPQGIRAEQLYRHKVLNSQDVYIPKGPRASLEALIQEYLSKLVEVDRRLNSIAANEFDALIDAGKAVSRSIDDAVAALPPKERQRIEEVKKRHAAITRESGKKNGLTDEQIEKLVSQIQITTPKTILGADYYMYTVRDGVAFGANAADLPTVSEIVAFQVQLIQDLGGQITNWFVEQGVLHSTKQVEILFQIQEWTQASYR
jgi:hypothetical protein